MLPLVARIPVVEFGVGPLELALFILLVLLVADVQGLPRPMAARMHFGLRSREWEFDRRLHIYREHLDHLLLSYRSASEWSVYRRWQRSAFGRGRRLVAQMRSLGAPDDQWALLRDVYATLCERIILRIAQDQPPDDDATLREGRELKRRADELRLKYRSEMQALTTRRQ